MKYLALRKRLRVIVCMLASLMVTAVAAAQCSICSKTASQMGEEAGRGLNGGILYLATSPLIIAGYLGYRWWRKNGKEEQQ